MSETRLSVIHMVWKINLGSHGTYPITILYLCMRLIPFIESNNIDAFLYCLVISRISEELHCTSCLSTVDRNRHKLLAKQHYNESN